MSNRLNQRSSYRTGGARRVVLVALAVLILAVVGAILAGPMILAGVVGGIIARAAGEGISGKVEVRNVSLSWTGSQRIGSIVLSDPSGQKVGEMSVRVEAGLIPLALGSRDLGTIRVRGLIDLRHGPDDALNLASAIAPARGKPIVVRPGATPTGPAPGAPGEVRLPAGLAFEVDASDLEVRYTARGTSGKPIGFKTVKGAGRFATGAGLEFELEARTLDGREGLTIDLQADRLTDDRGVLALGEAGIRLDVGGSLPADYTEVLASMIAPLEEGGASVGPAPDGGVVVQASFVSRDGRLVLAKEDEPANVTGRVPGALLRGISAGEAAQVHIDTPPRVSMGIQQLDVPLPRSGSLFDADWRDAIVVATLTVEEVSGTVALEDGVARAFRIEPVTATLRPMSRLFDLILTSTVRASFDERDAGWIEVDLRAAGLLDPEGRLKLGPFAPGGEGYELIPGPEYLRGKFVVQEFPTALLQPLAERAGFSLERVAGPVLAADLRTGVRQGPGELPTEVEVAEGEAMELPPVGQPYLAMTIASEKTSAWVDLILESGRLKTRNKGIRVDTEAAGEFIRAYLPEDGDVRVIGAGTGVISLENVDIPMAGGGPDLRAARGNYRIVLGKLDVQTGPDVSPVRLESIDAAIELAPGRTPTWGIDGRGAFEGEHFAMVGNGEVLGLLAREEGQASVYGLTPGTARPTGTLRLLDVPTRVASVVSARAGRIAEAVAGRTVEGTIESSRLAEGAVRIDATVEGNAAVAQGSFEADARRLVFDETGMTVTFFEPGALLNALADAGVGEPPLEFDGSGEARLTIRETTIPLEGIRAGMPLRDVVASVRLDATDLAGTIRAEGRTARLRLDRVNAGASLTREGALEISVNSEGRVDEEATTSSGTVAIRGLRGENGAIDLSKARLDGSWRAENVPTSLAALVAPGPAPILRETVGDRIDIALEPESGGSGGRGAWRLGATGREFELSTRVALGADAVEIGPTSGRAMLRPGAVEAGLALYRPEMTPRPRLARPVALSADAQAVSVPLVDGYRPDLSGGVRLSGSLRSGGDIVMENLPGLGGEGRVGAAGVRGLEVTASPSGSATKVTLDSRVFDPATDRIAATLSGSASLPMEGLAGTLVLSDADTGALDTMLATGGLISELVGDSLAVELRAEAPESGATAPIVAEVRSARLQVDAELTRSGEGLSLVRPARAEWLMTGRAMERVLFTGGRDEASPLRVERDVRVRVHVGELRLGPASGPLRGDVFRLASEVSVAPMAFVSARDSARVGLPASEGRLWTEPSTGRLEFRLNSVEDGGAAGGSGAGAEGSAGSLSVEASLEGYADAGGAPTIDRARLTSTVTGDLPSALLDALASMDGLLTALVGPRVAAEIRTQGLSRAEAAGTLDADVSAPYGRLRVEGRLEPGPQGATLVTTGSPEARLTRITNEVSQRVLAHLFPLLTNFEKTPDDQPAEVTGTPGLTLPLNGDVRSLNGRVRVDPGTMRFETNSALGRILSATHNRTIGTVGNRLEPFEIRFERGIAEYTDVIIPAGEFDIETYGRIDLVNDRVERLYALIPLYALQDDFAEAAGRVPGLKRATMIPIRFQGDPRNLKATIDFDELGKRIGDLLQNPGELIDQFLRDRRKEGGRNDGKKGE